jgi:hypothetical protein
MSISISPAGDAHVAFGPNDPPPVVAFSPTLERSQSNLSPTRERPKSPLSRAASFTGGVARGVAGLAGRTVGGVARVVAKPPPRPRPAETQDAEEDKKSRPVPAFRNAGTVLIPPMAIHTAISPIIDLPVVPRATDDKETEQPETTGKQCIADVDALKESTKKLEGSKSAVDRMKLMVKNQITDHNIIREKMRAMRNEITIANKRVKELEKRAATAQERQQAQEARASMESCEGNMKGMEDEVTKLENSIRELMGIIEEMNNASLETMNEFDILDFAGNDTNWMGTADV